MRKTKPWFGGSKWEEGVEEVQRQRTKDEGEW
jgi:hypothetical protein